MSFTLPGNYVQQATYCQQGIFQCGGEGINECDRDVRDEPHSVYKNGRHLIWQFASVRCNIKCSKQLIFGFQAFISSYCFNKRSFS